MYTILVAYEDKYIGRCLILLWQRCVHIGEYVIYRRVCIVEYEDT
jgi:hypothetical protein